MHMGTVLSQARTIVLALAAAFVIAVVPAHSQQTLGPEVRDVLKRLDEVNKRGGHSAGILSDADRALLFANNDAINAARINNEIPNSVYQAAQSDFADLNRSFAADAAAKAGADFTVQQRTSSTFSPGTDSDYITVVTDKKQIADMKTDYNRRVNDYLKKNGAIKKSRPNWQKTLDTDFMADPRYVSEADFREIAKMNNDAYKSRHAAEYEKISRTKGGGKIGPQHVTGYTQEMSDFARKKRAKVSEMFKNPSLFNDPANRAKAMQAMAQEQKYISRIESLDDYLRKQEGLPKRNRGKTTAAIGADRSPHNAKNIKDAYKVAEASRGKALEDLAETMGDVAKKNPHFKATAADDLAKIIANAPAEHQAKAIAALNRSNPELAKLVKARNPGLGSLDDAARAADKTADAARAADKAADAAKTADKLGDAAKLGKMRKGLKAAQGVLEKIGKIGAAADVLIAAAQMKDLLGTIDKALDPNTTDEEAADLFEQIGKMGKELAGSAAVVAIMERHPVVAAIYGGWMVACAAGSYVVSNRMSGLSVERTSSNESCTDRQIHAWDRANDWWSGKSAADVREAQERCNKVMVAIREKRLAVKPHFNVLDVCNAIKRRDPISDMVIDLDREPKTPPTKVVETCKPGETPTGQDGACEPVKGADGLTDEERKAVAEAQACAKAQTLFASAREQYRAGNMPGFKDGLIRTEQAMAGLPATACGGLTGKIAKGHEQADVIDQVDTAATGLLGACKGSNPRRQAARLRRLSTLLSKTDHAHVRHLKRRLDAAYWAASAYADAKDAFAGGDLDVAERRMNQAAAHLSSVDGGDCGDLRAAVAKGPKVIGNWRRGQAKTTSMIGRCDVEAMEKFHGRLQGMSSSIAATMAARIASALPRCRKTERDRDTARKDSDRQNKSAARRRNCIHKFGSGYAPGPVDADGRYYCVPNAAAATAWCNANNKGSGWRASRISAKGVFDCKKRTADAKKERNANCRRKFGRGYYAGRTDKKGSYFCLPTKKTANAWCRRNNKGRAYAGRIKANGSYACHWKKGKAPKRTVKRPPTRTHDTRNSAAAAAAAGAIIQGIINSGGSNTRRTTDGYRPPRNTSRSKSTRTQRSPTKSRPPKCRWHDKLTSKYWLNKTDSRCWK